MRVCRWSLSCFNCSNRTSKTCLRQTIFRKRIAWASHDGEFSLGAAKTSSKSYPLSLSAAPSDNYNYTPAAAIFPLLVHIHASNAVLFLLSSSRRPRADESNCGPFLLCRFNCALAFYAACVSEERKSFSYKACAAADCAPLKTSPRFNEPGGEKLYVRGDLKFRIRPSADFISAACMRLQMNDALVAWI